MGSMARAVFEMTKMPFGPLHIVLTEIHELLVKHDAGQSNCAAAAIRAVEGGNADAIATALNTLEFWGGAGSIDDLTLTEIPWTAVFRSDPVDQPRLRTLLGELLDQMQSANIAEPWVLARRADQLRTCPHSKVGPGTNSGLM
jgi:hypothetical protein